MPAPRVEAAKRFVVISGLPRSGKTTLARRLAPALHQKVIDKDDILERLFESEGFGDSFLRRKLSKKSDAILQREAITSDGAILVSFWHLPGMPSDSGTPTEWLTALDCVVSVHCDCPTIIAAQRFFQRKRHSGHLDEGASYAEVLASLQKLVPLGRLDIGHRIIVDTSHEPDLDTLVREIRAAFLGHGQ